MAGADRGSPRIRIEGASCHLVGDWTLGALRGHLLFIRTQLLRCRAFPDWDLTGIERIDSFGALLLWRSWGLKAPPSLDIPGHLAAAFERVAPLADTKPPRERRRRLVFLETIGRHVMHWGGHLIDFSHMLGMVLLEAARLLLNPRAIPFREFSAALYKTGVQAMPVAALVGFLIGVVLSYLSALQLRNFGADAFIINILGIGITRELGPVLVSILVAGRSGSAITAQLGVMRVTEELDALAAIGISAHQRLIWPKVVALACAMPLLVLWTSAAALAGGMLAAQSQLDIDWRYFLATLPYAVPVQNLYIGLVKGGLFGVTISLIACHFGLRIKPNTESLAHNTTASVVSAITAVLLLDAVLAMITRGIGVPVR